jgi:glycosyltransferase involved in cell wall biosynthesis
MDWYLPGTKAGGPVRSIYSLVSLIKDYFEIYVVTSNCDLGSDICYKTIEPNKLIENDGVFYYYFSKSELAIPNIVNLINVIQPDLVYINSFWSYNFSIGVVKAKQENLFKASVLLAPRGMMGKGALGLKPLRKTVFIALAKLFGWYKNIVFHATNEQEKRDILKRFKNAKVLTASNVNSGTVQFTAKQKEPRHLKLFYLSRIARVKNLHFALEVLQEVASDIYIEYDIFGNLEDKEYWNECQSIIQNFGSNIKVNYKKELQFNEVQATITNYHALFMPTLNENFGHSIVESLLCGCPVIISDQTPWNDLDNFNAGYAIDLNDKSNFVIALTNMALLNTKEYEQKSKDAIKYISTKFNVEQSVKQYIDLFNATIKN